MTGPPIGPFRRSAAGPFRRPAGSTTRTSVALLRRRHLNGAGGRGQRSRRPTGAPRRAGTGVRDQTDGPAFADICRLFFTGKGPPPRTRAAVGIGNAILSWYDQIRYASRYATLRKEGRPPRSRYTWYYVGQWRRRHVADTENDFFFFKKQTDKYERKIRGERVRGERGA